MNRPGMKRGGGGGGGGGCRRCSSSSEVRFHGAKVNREDQISGLVLGLLRSGLRRDLP